MVKGIYGDDSQDPRLVTAMLSGGCGGAQQYVATLRAAGVALPPDLSVSGNSRAIEVRHRWLEGSSLPEAAADSPAVFAAAVAEVGTWVQRLACSDARLDTNLANFRLTGGRVVTVDVLPPLWASLQPPPRDLFDTLFYALCFDTGVTLTALAGYAARQLLIHAHPRALRDCAPVITELISRADHATLGTFPGWLFQSRATAGLRGLHGQMPRAEALGFFRDTSVRTFQSLTENQRARKVRDVRERARELDL